MSKPVDRGLVRKRFAEMLHEVARLIEAYPGHEDLGVALVMRDARTQREKGTGAIIVWAADESQRELLVDSMDAASVMVEENTGNNCVPETLQ